MFKRQHNTGEPTLRASQQHSGSLCNTHIRVSIRYWKVHWLQVLDLCQVWQGTSVGECAHASPPSRASTPCVGYGGGDGDVGAPLDVIYSGTKNTEKGKPVS